MALPTACLALPVDSGRAVVGLGCAAARVRVPMPSPARSILAAPLLLAAGLLAACDGDSGVDPTSPDAGPARRPDAGGIPVPVVRLSQSSLSLAEGEAATVSVHLSLAPAAPVVVAATTTLEGVEVTPASLSFDAATWSTPREVTVRALADASRADREGSIYFSDGDRVIVGEDVHVAIEDVAPVFEVEGPRSLREGESATVTVRLTRPVATDVVATVQPSIPGVTATPSTVTFTAADWQARRTVTLSAAHDDDRDDHHPVRVTIAAAAAGIAPSELMLSVLDDELYSVRAPVDFLRLFEGESQTVALRLAVAPREDVVVDLTTSQPTKLSVAPAQLRFTPANWNVDQVATLTGLDDDDRADTGTGLHLKGDLVRSGVVLVTVKDND